MSGKAVPEVHSKLSQKPKMELFRKYITNKSREVFSHKVSS